MKTKHGDLRVWWIPQIPSNPFHVAVDTPQEAKKLLTVLADYDLFQFENKIKPDYSNAGGLEVYSTQDHEWSEWHDKATDDDIDAWEPAA